MAVRTPEGRFASPPEKTSPMGEVTGAQKDLISTAFSHTGSFGSLLYANGGSANNPMGFPGYDSMYTGSYATYRWILQHPVVQLVRSICVGPILASTWEYESENNAAPENVMIDVKNTFNRLRPRLIRDFYVRGRDYGWQGGEIIWSIRDGRYFLERVKPLAHEYTDVMQDKFGNMVGLRNYARYDGQETSSNGDLSTPYKAWKYTYDSECGYHYGRSWLENVRATGWKMWLDCAQQLQKLAAKISGVVTVITSPAGSFPGVDKDGRQVNVSYRKNAEEAIKALAEGAAGVWFPSLGLAPDSRGNIDAMKLLAELAGKSLTSINVLDFGSQASAIGPILNQMKHAEELIFAGGLRSARTGLEAEHGTKEEAGVHTDTGTINAESEDEDFAAQCQPLVDAYVGLNYSPKLVGKVRIKPPSLVDRKTQVYRALLLAMMNSPEIVLEMAATLDMTKLMATLDLPQAKQWSFADIIKRAEEAAKQQQEMKQVKNPEPQGGRPKE